jgi:CelD/BcsL family acetyltransferase involved in cellulose biosynthesis
VTTRDADFEVSVYTSFEEMEGLAAEWDELAERAGGDVYATFDWCMTWWEYYGKGRRLEAAIVRRGERLVGVLPFFRETLWLGGLPARLLRLIGCDHSVTTTNVTVERGLERDVFGAWAARAGKKWDAVILGPLPGYEERAHVFAEALGMALPGARVEYKADCGPHIVFDLPRAFGEYRDGLSKREKANILQDDRRMRREHKLSVVARTDAGEVKGAFERFLPLHQMLWQVKGRLGHFGDWPECEAFHRTLVEKLGARGRVVFMELEADGKTVASQYAFAFGKRVHWFLAGRDDAEAFNKISLGRMGLMTLVEWAIGKSCSQIDGMRGYYDYKLKQGGRLTALQAVRVTGAGARSRLAMRLFDWAAWVLHTAYYRVWFMRVARRLGVSAPLWETWIRARL